MSYSPLHPCVGCIYYKECGSTTRTEKCEGRVTKSQKKLEVKKDASRRHQ